MTCPGEVARALRAFGYDATRQTGSHIRLTSKLRGSEHHVTIPDHSSVRVGTLSAVIADVANYLGNSKDEVARALFDA